MIEVRLVHVLPGDEGRPDHYLLVLSDSLEALRWEALPVDPALAQRHLVLLHLAVQGGHHQVTANVYACVLYTLKGE